MAQSIHSIKEKRVLLKVDLEDYKRFPYKLDHIMPTVQVLLEQGCGVCVVSSIGPAFMKPVASTQPLVQLLEARLARRVHFVPSLTKASIKLGLIYLSENPFCDRGEMTCDPDYVACLKTLFDVVVYDTLKLLDAHYATTQGVLNAGIPSYFGTNVQKLAQLQSQLSSSRVGAIMGGRRIAWQLQLIQTWAPNLSFIAVGGEMALVMMGKQSSVFGHVKDTLSQTLALIRKHRIKVLYPIDVIAYSADSQRSRVCLYQDVEEAESVHDLGSKSRDRILSHIDNSDIDMVLFSDVLGEYLDPRYSRGSEYVMQELVKRQHPRVLIGRNAILTAQRLSVLGGYHYILEGHTLEMQYLTTQSNISTILSQTHFVS